jgi:glycosyltransferase involved in cell wall biosynthesis
MATIPYFLLSPSTLLSVSGLFRGPDTTRPTPADNWREATVDVVIPALNEADNIVLCLASVLQQTVRPRRIVLVDDGSTDATVERAKAFCANSGLELVAIQRRKPIGKTPTIKRQAREFDSDVEFILDADTVLTSSNYIERTVQELYQAVGIASAFGTVLPQRKKDRRQIEDSPEVRSFVDAHPSGHTPRRQGWLADLRRGTTNTYREVLYLFLQRFVYRGQMAFFGTTTNPVGCAVAYRRKYVRALFDYVDPILGDDLTNSEDIFIGFAMLNEGYRNIQLADVYARTVEPEVQHLPRQIYLWSSAFLQSCYYFDSLVRSPLKALKRWHARHRPSKGSAVERARANRAAAFAGPAMPMFSTAGVSAGLARTITVPRRDLPSFAAVSGDHHVDGSGTGHPATTGDRRVVREPYRQAFGRARSERFGRPAGWILMMSAIEKVFFPTVLLAMAILGNWHGLAWTVAIDTIVCVTALAAVMKGRRLEYVLKGIAVTPVRYALLGSEVLTIGRFAVDVWLTNNRKWRK